MILKEIQNETAVDFLKKNHAHREVVFIRSHDKWFGVFDNDNIIAVCGIDFKKNHIEIAGTFVIPDMRRKGICTSMYHKILNIYGSNDIIGYFRPSTSKIVEKMGFVSRYEYSNGTKKMFRSKINGKTEN